MYCHCVRERANVRCHCCRIFLCVNNELLARTHKQTYKHKMPHIREIFGITIKFLQVYTDRGYLNIPKSHKHHFTWIRRNGISIVSWHFLTKNYVHLWNFVFSVRKHFSLVFIYWSDELDITYILLSKEYYFEQHLQSIFPTLVAFDVFFFHWNFFYFITIVYFIKCPMPRGNSIHSSKCFPPRETSMIAL